MNCNVVLSGSGIRFPHFVGALQALHTFSFKINAIAGTSGGSIVASTYAYSLDTYELQKHILNLNLQDYIRINWTFWRGYSVYKINEKKFQEKIYSITKRENIEDAFIPLKIVTTNISKSKIVVAQKGNVSKWVLASLSAPLVFRYQKIGKSLFVDGGLCKNLLADAWIDRKDEITFLFYFPTCTSPRITSFMDYITNLVSTTLSCNVDDEIEDVLRLRGNKVFIIPLNSFLSPFDFKNYNLYSKDMIDQTYNEVTKFLNKNLDNLVL